MLNDCMSCTFYTFYITGLHCWSRASLLKFLQTLTAAYIYRISLHTTALCKARYRPCFNCLKGFTLNTLKTLTHFNMHSIIHSFISSKMIPGDILQKYFNEKAYSGYNNLDMLTFHCLQHIFHTLL